MTLYLKYRPQRIDELDITSVRVSLTNILKSDSIPHSFLFSGPRGTGKTSSARILAKAINCEKRLKDGEPCNECEECMSITNGTNIDVIEMDAASNRGIDDVRALRDIVKLAPAKSKAKVYIIDEAHMLTNEASNALLKTLEEPPAHVYFIMATTNPEKLIETIKSRVTLIPFTKATPAEISRSLKRVVEGEKIKISDEDLIKIAKISKGSFRDAVKSLEQYSQDESFLQNQTGLDVNSLVELISKKDFNGVVDVISNSVNNGLNVGVVTELILEELQTEMLCCAGVGKAKYNFEQSELILLIELIIQSVNDSKISPIEELPLQLAIFKWIGDDDKSNPEPKSVKKNEEPIKEKVIKDEAATEKVSPTVVINEIPKKKFSTIDKDSWNKILAEVKPINASIEGLLRMSEPLGFDGDNLQIGVYYKFHKDKLEEQKTKKMLEDVILKVFDRNTRIECFLNDSPPKVQLTNVKNENIMNVAEEMFS